jgi:hypothetical protein
MRASSRGTVTYSAFLTVAVVGSEGRANVAYAKLERGGLYVAEDELLRERRPDGAVVLHAVDRHEPEAIVQLATESHALTAPERGGVALERAAFQPIWAVWPTLGPLGFELLVVDDDDAIHQLDAFYNALAGDSVLSDMKRSHLTIRPRGRWCGYGHPDISSGE